jgi:hypothetical protein
VSLKEGIKAFTDILAIVAWPAVVAWLGYVFRMELKEVARRLVEVGPTGAKFAPPSVQIPSPPTEGAPSPPASPASPPAETIPPAARAEGYINFLRTIISSDQLDPHVQVLRQNLLNIVGADPTAQIEALLYTAAIAHVQLTHERNYGAIYGSQLRLLALANPDTGIPEQLARQIYEEAKTANPEAYSKASFEQWVSFLFNAGLIRASEGNFLLTPYGRGLLKYIVDRHLPTTKPL